MITNCIQKTQSGNVIPNSYQTYLVALKYRFHPLIPIPQENTFSTPTIVGLSEPQPVAVKYTSRSTDPEATFTGWKRESDVDHGYCELTNVFVSECLSEWHIEINRARNEIDRNITPHWTLLNYSKAGKILFIGSFILCHLFRIYLFLEIDPKISTE
jgi:hypothetical protein